MLFPSSQKCLKVIHKSRPLILDSYRVIKKCSYRFLSYHTLQTSRCISYSSKLNSCIEGMKNHTAPTNDDEFEGSSLPANIDIHQITNSRPEKMNEFKALLLEVELMRQEGENVPKELKTQHWIKLLSIQKKSLRSKYLFALWLREAEKEEAKRKSERYRKLLAEKKKADAEKGPIKFTTSGPIVYGLSHNSLFHRIYPPQIDRCYNYRLMKAMMFDLRVLVDCSFESLMSPKNLSHCVKQMQNMWAVNRIHFLPHHLIFCNVDPHSKLMEELRKILHGLDQPDFPFFHTSKSYLDLYPKEKLIYLTPDAKTELVQYNPEDVYIIGGIVDRGIETPLTFVKAKKENLRTAKFPLDKYLNWGFGSKCLELHTVMAIMNDLKQTGRWELALKNIPRARLKDCNSINVEDPSTGESESTVYSSIGTTNSTRQNILYDLLLKNRNPLKKEKS